jgi:hypothetical protein
MLNKAEVAIHNNEIDKNMLNSQVINEKNSTISAINYANEL